MEKELEIFRESVASELRSLRAKYNLTTEEVANISGLNKDTIIRYEKAKVSITLDNLIKLLSAYNIQINIFLKIYMRISRIKMDD